MAGQSHRLTSGGKAVPQLEYCCRGLRKFFDISLRTRNEKMKKPLRFSVNSQRVASDTEGLVHSTSRRRFLRSSVIAAVGGAASLSVADQLLRGVAGAHAAHHRQALADAYAGRRNQARVTSGSRSVTGDRRSNRAGLRPPRRCIS